MLHQNDDMDGLFSTLWQDICFAVLHLTFCSFFIINLYHLNFYIVLLFFPYKHFPIFKYEST